MLDILARDLPRGVGHFVLELFIQKSGSEKYGVPSTKTAAMTMAKRLRPPGMERTEVLSRNLFPQ
jgi:hypothetical protein